MKVYGLAADSDCYGHATSLLRMQQSLGVTASLFSSAGLNLPSCTCQVKSTSHRNKRHGMPYNFVKSFVRLLLSVYTRKRKHLHLSNGSPLSLVQTIAGEMDY